MQLTKELNDQLMATAAFRYCLGRGSYIVGACQEWLEATWDQFDRNTQRVMVRDAVLKIMRCESSFMQNRLKSWRLFAERAFNSLCAEDQQWVRESVAHKQQPWPLNNP